MNPPIRAGSQLFSCFLAAFFLVLLIGAYLGPVWAKIFGQKGAGPLLFILFALFIGSAYGFAALAAKFSKGSDGRKTR